MTIAKFTHPANGICSEKYMRTNKKNGIKNLKCFPECVVNNAHGRGTICNDNIVMSLTPEAFDYFPIGTPILSIGRIMVLDETEQSDPYFDGVSAYIVGQSYPREHVLRLIRNKSDSVLPEILGEFTPSTNPQLEGPGSIIFESRGWHYGWSGGRYKIHQQHHFEAFIFIQSATTGLFQCIERLCTTPFEVFSARRADPTDKLKRRVNVAGKNTLSPGSTTNTNNPFGVASSFASTKKHELLHSFPTLSELSAMPKLEVETFGQFTPGIAPTTTTGPVVAQQQTIVSFGNGNKQKRRAEQIATCLFTDVMSRVLVDSNEDSEMNIQKRTKFNEPKPAATSIPPPIQVHFNNKPNTMIAPIPTINAQPAPFVNGPTADIDIDQVDGLLAELGNLEEDWGLEFNDEQQQQKTKQFQQMQQQQQQQQSPSSYSMDDSPVSLPELEGQSTPGGEQEDEFFAYNDILFREFETILPQLSSGEQEAKKAGKTSTKTEELANLLRKLRISNNNNKNKQTTTQIIERKVPYDQFALLLQIKAWDYVQKLMKKQYLRRCRTWKKEIRVPHVHRSISVNAVV